MALLHGAACHVEVEVVLFKRSVWLTLGVMCVLAGAGQAAWAQSVYRCSNEAGRPYMSDKPCTTTKIQQYGPVPQQQTPSQTPAKQRSPSAGSYRSVDVPPHHEYLSGECRILSEGARSALTTGGSYEILRGLQREWQQRCQDDDEQARRRYQAQQRDERMKKDDERLQQDHSKAQQQALQDQCAEMRRILRNKRERQNMTAGERADLTRFEENYKSRCGG